MTSRDVGSTHCVRSGNCSILLLLFVCVFLHLFYLLWVASIDDFVATWVGDCCETVSGALYWVKTKKVAVVVVGWLVAHHNIKS